MAQTEKKGCGVNDRLHVIWGIDELRSRSINIRPSAGDDLRLRLQSRHRYRLGKRLLDPGVKQAERAALVVTHLAIDQVDRLNAGRAFMNCVQTVVAIELFDLEITRISCAAVNLDSEIERALRPFGWPALGQRRQQR